MIYMNICYSVILVNYFLILKRRKKISHREFQDSLVFTSHVPLNCQVYKVYSDKTEMYLIYYCYFCGQLYKLRPLSGTSQVQVTLLLIF